MNAKRSAARPSSTSGQRVQRAHTTIHPDFPVYVEIINVSPAQAAQWLQECAYPNQRRLRNWHVDELVYAQRAGQLKLGSIEFYCYDGREYLTDGQHRLNAIAKSGIGAVLVVIRVDAGSMEEVAAAYYRTDAGLGRPFSEAIPLSGVLEQTGLTDKEVELTSRATRFIQNGFGDKSTSTKGLCERNRDVRFQAVCKWGIDAKAYFQTVGNRHELLFKSMVTKVPVALGIVTLHHQSEKAKEFWSAIADNDGLRKGTAEYAAFGVLANASNDKMPLNLYARKLAYCWNAFWDGREINSVVVRDPKKPLLLKGTPYDGMQTLRYGPDMNLIVDED